MCHRPLGTSCARLILPREGHGGDGVESRYQFHGENDEMLQRSVRELGALAPWVGPVLDFATEIHAAAQTSAKPVNITAERYHYDPTRFRVTFELPKLPGQPRRRVRKVAPAGLGLEQALAWARRSEREVLQELLLGGGAPEEDRPNPSRQPLQPSPAPAKAKSTEPPVPTLSEFWARFCAEYLAKTKPGTRRGYASIFSNYLGPVLGAHRLDQIDRAALAALKRELGKLPEVSSRNQVLYKLRKIFERAVAWYILRDDQVPRSLSTKLRQVVEEFSVARIRPDSSPCSGWRVAADPRQAGGAHRSGRDRVRVIGAG